MSWELALGILFIAVGAGAGVGLLIDLGVRIVRAGKESDE